jgi:predicted dithiol-disulfide oxidoreductase (DUF899 family)
MTQAEIEKSKVVSKKEWLLARKELLVKEKALTRQMDALNAERLKLPWEKVEKNYVFDGAKGKQPFAELFDGRSQLILYHFMFGPEWKEGCPSCSLLADHLDGSLTHLANRDITLIAISRAPYAQLEAFKKRMGWRFKWYSSFGTEFNWDYHVSFTKEEAAKKQMYYNYAEQHFPAEEGPGASVFYKDAGGNIFHTYSTFGRGGEPFIGAYNFLDIAPKGRDEASLPHPMAWVRHHDRYEKSYFDEGAGSDALRTQAAGSCCAGEHKG